MPDNENLAPTGENETTTNETTANDLVLRYQFESYMKCRDGSVNLIGEGFTAFPEAKNAQEYSRKYINYKTEKTDVIGYSPSVGYSCDAIPSDPVVEDVMYITDHELVGAATHREIICVNRWDEDENGKCAAYKRKYAIIPDTKGDGTEALVYSGTMKAVSDIVFGTFDTTNNTFEATA